MNEVIGILGMILAVRIMYWSLNDKYDFESKQ